MNDDDGPFTSLIIKHCHTTSSQDHLLRPSPNSPFSTESPIFSAESLSSEPLPTMIVMLSPPESFHTPTEDSLSQIDPVNGLETTMVDGVVDLGKDLDNLGFEDSGGVELGKFRVLQRESNLVVTNCNENGGTEILDSGVDEIGERFCEDTRNVDLPLKEIEEGVGLGEGDEVQKNGGGGSIRKNIEDLDNFKYISSSGVNRSGKVTGVGGRLELSSTFSVLSSNAAKQTVKGTLAAKNQIMKDLLDALKMIAGELDDGSGEDVDFLETANKCGMTFPRPRWWPQDGYDD
ncbi:unnamed protein product [Camellia sinensis]